MTVDESIASMKASLLKKIKRSAYVYRVDCGGCNGCEIEIFATLSPLFDAERFGIKVVPSPRHADILLFTGAVTRAMRSRRCAHGSRRRIRRSVSPTAPAATAAASSTTCTASGAVPIKSYRSTSIPGCPPTPAATLYGFAMALGLLEQKIHARLPGELDEQPTELLHADMVQPLRVRIDREARRLAGYRYGRQIADDYMRLLGGATAGAALAGGGERSASDRIVTHLNRGRGGAYPMSETVVFSQLSRKFIDENDATPDQAQQVVYYSPAIGHHLGVIDCLEAALSCRGTRIWHGSPPLRPEAPRGAKWRACRSMAKSSSTAVMWRCWPTPLIKRSPRRPRSSRRGAKPCSACCMIFTRERHLPDGEEIT